MKTFASICAALAFSLASVALAAETPLPAGVKKGPSVEGITEYDLANGLRVLFAPDASKPTTTVNTTYLVGSRNENYGETGMAHLLEHLMFKGSPKYPQVWKEFTSRGLRANGSTWTDRTNYFASFAANDKTLEWYLSWSADAMTHSFIARKDLDSEMTVVRNELELGENNPFRVLIERATSAAYTWHNYGKSTIGARVDVENVNIEHLQAFYRKFYQPDNAVLIIAGRFDEARTLAFVAKTFGAIPRPKRVLEPTYTIDGAQDGERSVTVRRVGDTSLALALYHIPAGSSPDYAAIEILDIVLGDQPTGRLHKALVETKEAAGVYGFSFGFKEPGVAMYVAQVPSDGSLLTAKVTLIATTEGFAKTPVTQAEVDRARAKYLKDFELTASDPEKVGVALSSSIAQGDWRLFFLERDRVRSVKVDDVQRVATQYFIPDNRTLGSFIPTAKPERAPAPAFVDVPPMVKDYRGDAPVVAGEVFEATPENIEKRAKRLTLANGMKVTMVAKKTRGATVNAEFVVRFGDEKSLFGTDTLGDLTASMLDRGAGGMTRQEIQDAFDKLKARVEFSGGGAYAVGVEIETIRENFPAVMQLVAKILRSPTFPAAEFEQLKSEEITQIESQRKEPTVLGARVLQRHGNPYPKGDIRYVMDFDEQIASIKAATVDEAKAYYSRFYGADHVNFAAAGDFDPDALAKQVAELYGDWKSSVPWTRLARPNYDIAPTSIKLETPDKANAYFGAALQFPMRDDSADYAAVLVANRIYGGGPGSLLWQRVREKEGLSYGIVSRTDTGSFDVRTAFSVWAIYAPQNGAKLEKAFQEVTEHAGNEGFTAELLKDAKAGLLQARKLTRAQDKSLVGLLAQRSDYDRTLAFDAKVDQAIETVTLEQVNAAFKKYIDPSKLTTVRAGDFAKAAAAPPAK